MGGSGHAMLTYMMCQPCVHHVAHIMSRDPHHSHLEPLQIPALQELTANYLSNHDHNLVKLGVNHGMLVLHPRHIICHPLINLKLNSNFRSLVNPKYRGFKLDEGLATQDGV